MPSLEIQNHTNPSTDGMTDWQGRRAKFCRLLTVQKIRRKSWASANVAGKEQNWQTPPASQCLISKGRMCSSKLTSELQYEEIENIRKSKSF